MFSVAEGCWIRPELVECVGVEPRDGGCMVVVFTAHRSYPIKYYTEDEQEAAEQHATDMAEAILAAS